MNKRILCAAMALLLMVLPLGVRSEGDGVTGRAEMILSGMTLEQKVYQMFIVTPEKLTGADAVTKAGDATRDALERYPVGGLVYFAVNLKDRVQTSGMIDNTKAFAGELGMPGLFIAVDEEGGAVARVASKLKTTKFPSMMSIGKKDDPKQVYDAYQTIASDISQFGFNLDFAPVADVITNPKNTEIGNRAFGTDASKVAGLVPEAVKGLQDNGVIAAIKHFPGHGNTVDNSHYKTTTTKRTLDQMRECELLPFESGIRAGAEFVLVSHLTATKVDDSAPASMNKKIITGILRDELGYKGVVVTDALRMQAISDNYTPKQVGLMCVRAGVDVLLMPKDFKASAQAIINAVKDGSISEERIDQSVRRILSAKLRYGIAE